MKELDRDYVPTERLEVKDGYVYLLAPTGEVAYFDEELLHLLQGKTKFFITGKSPKYFTTTINKKPITLHNLLYECSEGNVLDHSNNNTFDNTIDNIREVTPQQNLLNKKKYKNNRSGYKGVVRIAPDKWKAIISKNNIRYDLGSFNSPMEAALAYDEKAKSLHRKYANLNFPNGVQKVTLLNKYNI